MAEPVLYVYRLVVDSWPTPDGKPWARFYGTGAQAPNHVIPEWLRPLLDDAVPLIYAYGKETPRHRVAARLKWDDHAGYDEGELMGVLMPRVSRAHYLSASGAHELARDLRAFGAVVRVIRSARVEWPTTEESSP